MRLPYLRSAAPDVIATAEGPTLGPRRSAARAAQRGGHRPRRRHPADAAQDRRTSPPARPSTTWDPTTSLHPRTRPRQALPHWNGSAGAENLAVCGPSGTGKSHFVEALATAAIEAGRTVAWFTLETLGALVAPPPADDSITRTVARILRVDLIVVDDIGMLPVGQDAAEAFYRVVDAAYERRSIAVSSQHPPRRLRQAHAQDPGHRHRRPAPAPRPRLRHRRRLVPARPSHHRQGGDAAGQLINPGKSHVRPRGVFTTTSEEIS